MSEFTSKSVWPTVLAVVGVFAIFLVILKVAQTPVQPLNSPASPPEEERWRYSDEGRASRLVELRGRETAAMKDYGWVDEANGVVRLPLDRAIELTITDANAKS